MPAFWIFVLVLAIAVVGYFMGRSRALASGGGDIRNLHSLPAYYGYNAALVGLVPALVVLVGWTIAQPLILQNSVSGMISENQIEEAGSLGLVMSDVRRVAEGLDTAVLQGAMTQAMATNINADFSDVRGRLGEIGVALGSDVTQETLRAAQTFRAQSGVGTLIKTALVLLISVGGTAFALMQTNADFRARNRVEQGIMALLIAAASIAILTTIGIVLSLIFNTIEFLHIYGAGILASEMGHDAIEAVVASNAELAALLGEDFSDTEFGRAYFNGWQTSFAGLGDFFTNLEWAPSFSGRGGASELGILPLLWGTLYISVVALLVAVPIGLFSAIYLSEYATPAVRGFAKPLLEVLAGIPTIVYGLFALLTVGPLLSTVFADGGALGVTWQGGDRAVMTAGLVMGIMLIPFVSSLSDDIINAVPQAMRDGSLGLGATHSETVRQVILPAALPGIVGAVLLAASRAIGETMIVVLGAGAAARLSLNPFEAMTTVTAKIVSQLTGDSDFSSPEALVAFALGMTLFIVTLGLNVFALYIVRKYREQYE